MVAAKSKLKVKVDIPKNWLIFHYSGQINKKQLNSLYTDVRFCVADLKPGFHVISDFSQCSLANLNCIPVLSKIMNYLIENKVAEVIRIIQEGSLIHTQLTNYSIRRQGYKPTYVRSFREAEIYLNNLKGENQTRIELKNLKVNYTANDIEGVGTLHELSTDCCTIQKGSITPALDEQLSVQFELRSKNDTPTRFSLPAQVTAIDNELITCEFTDLTEDRRDELWKCLVFESQREV